MNDIDHLKTHPVIKWAQSQSQIFLNIRLSHRHDSPTCSDIRFQEIQTNVDQSFGDITIKKFHKQSQINYSTLKFLSQCYFTHQKLLFNLQIDFSSLITTLQVKKQGFGRFTIIGQKQRPQIWIHPFTGYKNAGIWSQMRNKYSADMDKYFQFIQQSKDSSKNNKPNKKYRNKKSTHQSQKIQQIQKTQL